MSPPFWTLVLLQLASCLYISPRTELLREVLSDFEVFRPRSTDSAGRFLSHAVSAPRADPPPPRSRRQTPASGREEHLKDNREEDRGGGGDSVFYNMTIFGRELHLRLRPNSRLVAPGATVDWQQESGGSARLPLADPGCHYSGDVTNAPDTAVALSTCQGLAGMIRLGEEKFFIEPLERARGKELGKEELGEERGQEHLVYRMSDIIPRSAGVRSPAEDFLRGSFLGTQSDLFLKQKPLNTSARHRRQSDEEEELFNVEVLLGVDYSVLLFHGREHIQLYLLTLMNIVNEIYQDHSLGANINIVLVRIIMLSASKSQELIEVWNPSKSLENVCRWAFLQQRAEHNSEHHDHAVYITRQEFGPGGMQGYAPVTGMCQSVRSCTLTLEDGFSSAFVIAHETGHVLGMEHDDRVNGCEDEVVRGSIMSPRVQAAFHQYHWSRCSRQELRNYLHTYDCLRDDPFRSDWPAEPQLPGLQFSMDQQCRFDFGSDYTTCTAYDPCKQLWCSHHDNPFFCKTKKSPPIDGTPCGPGKNCFKGYCLHLTPDLLRQDGGWSSWSAFGGCSRSCGGGVQYRTRHCSSPPPGNGGRPCIGNRFEFQLCSLTDCPAFTDYRAEQCQLWDHDFEHKGTKHHWLAYENPEVDDRCQLYCRSRESDEVVYMETQVHDGTRCSYSDAYSVCVRGECEHVGCDQQVASERQEDRCGVCGGDNSTCQVIKGNFTRSAKQGYLKILEIPAGARHLLVMEHRASPHLLALKNQVSGLVFLNGVDQPPRSQGLLEGGVAWSYTLHEDRETLETSGPLSYGVLIMMRCHGDSKVTVSYKYVIKEGLKPPAVDNRLHDDTVSYQWALKKWSHCSRPCGAGKQYTRFGCRRKADGKMVHRVYCSNVNKPRAISRWCNTLPCPLASWALGPWGVCSTSCGPAGYQTRWVRCQQGGPSSGGGARRSSISSRLCPEERPAGRRPCAPPPCPPTWTTSAWSPCSVTCGNGTAQRQVLCGSHLNVSCDAPKPSEQRPCLMPACDRRNSTLQWLSRAPPSASPQPPARQRCRGDQSVFCRLQVLSRYCSMPKYRQMCCKSCRHGNFTSRDNVSINTELLTRSLNSTPDSSPRPDRKWSPSAPPPPPTPTPSTRGGTGPDFVYVDFEDYEDSSEGSTVSTATRHSVRAPAGAAPTWTTPIGTMPIRATPIRASATRTTPIRAPPTLTTPIRAPPTSFSNAVDEVWAGEGAGGIRTQNKRIQQLLNEKLRREGLRRTAHPPPARTHRH